MHVVIVGCGRVGSALANDLLDGGHSVAVIDRRPEAFDRLGTDFAGQTLAGIGFDRETLIAAGIERADAVAAVTSGDNSNILVARVASETFGVQRVVARIYDPQRAAVYQRLGIATVATVSWTTQQVLRGIVPDQNIVEWQDPSARVAMVERHVDGRTAGTRYDAIEATAGARVVAVTRLGASRLMSPGLVAQEGDVVYIAIGADSISSLDAAFSGQPAHAH